MRWPWGRGEQQELEEALNPVPAVEPAARAYAGLGGWQPMAVAIGCAAALGVADLLGGVTFADFGWKAVAIAALGTVAVAIAGLTRGRDHLHDRMRLAQPIPEGAEVEEEDDGRLVRALAPTLVWAVVVLGATEAADLMGGSGNHWFLLLTAIGIGESVRAAAAAVAVRAEERARGVRLFRIADREHYEDVKGDLPDSDPGPMFTGP